MMHKNHIETKITDKVTKWEMRADYFLVARKISHYLMQPSNKPLSVDKKL